MKQLRKSEAPRRQSAVFSRAAGRCGLQKVKQLRKSRALRRPSTVFSRAAGRPRVRKVKQLRKSRASPRQSAVFSGRWDVLGRPRAQGEVAGRVAGPRAGGGREGSGGRCGTALRIILQVQAFSNQGRPSRPRYMYLLRPRESPNSRVCGRTLVLRRRRARWQARAREARVFSCARFRRRLGCVFGRDFVCDFVCDFVRRGEQNVHTRSPNVYIGDRDITARRNHRRHHRRDLDGAREQKGQERSKALRRRRRKLPPWTDAVGAAGDSCIFFGART